MLSIQNLKNLRIFLSVPSWEFPQKTYSEESGFYNDYEEEASEQKYKQV